MMNVLNVMSNSARNCTNKKECICVACTRKKRLAMLGFSEKAVEEYISSVDKSGK